LKEASNFFLNISHLYFPFLHTTYNDCITFGFHNITHFIYATYNTSILLYITLLTPLPVEKMCYILYPANECCVSFFFPGKQRR